PIGRSALSSPCPAKGEGHLRRFASRNNEHSRDAFAPELCPPQRQNRFASSRKREAERRKAHPTNSAQHRQTLPLADARARRRAMQTSTQSAQLSACGARSPSGATP